MKSLHSIKHKFGSGHNKKKKGEEGKEKEKERQTQAFGLQGTIKLETS